MSHDLAGNAVLFDRANSILLSGRLAIVSDGYSRSEIVIRELDGDREERLVFTHGTSWVPVYHLIQVIRELYGPGLIDINQGEPFPCPQCEGRRMVEDEDGNWQDCSACVP